MLALLFLLLSRIDFVKSDGQLEIEFQKYKHAANKVIDGWCCDLYLNFWCTECENYFSICYREYNPSDDKKCLASPPPKTGHFGSDVTFQRGPGALGNSVNNPVSFKFKGAWMNSFSLKITIMDHDSDSGVDDDLIDVLRAGVQHTGISNAWTGMTIRGKYSKFLSLRWRVQCDTHYYGKCGVFCMPQDDDNKGHYDCNLNTGARICLKGWTGAPQCNTPICRTGCSSQHGYCEKPNECKCRSGWMGSNCTVCKTKPDCKNGYCINGGECICNSPDWIGPLCDQNATGCSNNPCRNGGTCTVTQDSYNCTCLPDFTGANCAIDMNQCRSNPCLSNSTCRNLPNNFACDCQPGYTGRNCSTEINECLSDPCLYGNCSDLVSSFACTCRPGFTGQRCDKDVDECESERNYCTGANMLCENTFGGHTCGCKSGYQAASNGLSCKPTQCGQLNYLLNTTTIVVFSDDYRSVNSTANVSCVQGYSMNGTSSLSLICLDDGSWDKNPEGCADIDECASGLSSCGAGMACNNTVGGYTCPCILDYEETDDGSFCERIQCPKFPSHETTMARYVDDNRWVGMTVSISCRPGYNLPKSAPRTLRCLDSGTWDRDPEPCTDIDECEALPEPCPRGEECYNTPGSYECEEGDHSTKVPRICDEDTSNCISDDKEEDDEASSNLGLYIGVSVGCVVLLVTVIVIIVFAFRRRRPVKSRTEQIPSPTGLELEEKTEFGAMMHNPVYSQNHSEAETDHYDTIADRYADVLPVKRSRESSNPCYDETPATKLEVSADRGLGDTVISRESENPIYGRGETGKPGRESENPIYGKAEDNE